ncbi:MAG: zf-TFIIB domain-containing protein [Planctomycetaceae bacterium]
MKCQSCGSPLSLQSASRIPRCSYCDSHNLLPTDGVSIDGVVFLGNLTNRECPACGDQLVAAALDNQPVEACPNCFGVAVRDVIFADLVDGRRSSYRGPVSPPIPLDTRELETERDCPDCREPMHVHPYYGPGTTVIDSCPACQLIWLDPGELSAIEVAPGRRWA